MAFWNFWKKKKSASDSYFGSESSPLIKTNDKVMIMTCKHCNEYVIPGKKHFCSSNVRGSSFTAPVNPTADSPNFTLSYVIADATDNMLMGYAVGGSLIGAILGASAHNYAARHVNSDSSNNPVFAPPDQVNTSPKTYSPAIENISQSEEQISAPSRNSSDSPPSYDSGSSSSSSSSSGE